MAKQKTGLGRGLDALFSGPAAPSPNTITPLSHQSVLVSVDTASLPLVPIDSVIPNPRQPRRVFREDDPKLLELSASIKEHGLIQPIVVTRLKHAKIVREKSDAWFGEEELPSDKLASTPDGIQYQLIAGERRWRAARLAGLNEIPVVIKDVTSQQMLELALIENIQRADLNPIEEALAYQALIQEFGLKPEEVGKQVGKDRTTITNAVRLLQLPPKVRDALINQPENFTQGHARALIEIQSEEEQIQAMQQVIALQLTVRQTEELAKRIKNRENVEAAVKSVAPPPRRSPELADIETHFRNALMLKVDLKCNAKGKGTVILHFNNQDELESLYNRLVQKEE